jgi:peptidoglycan hydrolase-like protein with peptidoglycan-binding domain
MDRRVMAAGVIGLVVVASIVGYVVGSRITSPADVASRTAPPEAALILVPVEQRVVSADVVTRGTGKFGSPQKLSTAASALKHNPGLIAELPLAGAELAEGDVALSASGRPLFVLAGERPMSRDLGPGLSGDDVRQLEEALVRLGFDVGDADGTYDEGTAAGVAAWYLSNGYAAFTATPDQLATVRAREVDLATASIDVLSAADALASAEASGAAARSALTTANIRRDGATRGVARAESEARAAAASAAAEVSARQLVVDRLRSGATVQRGTAAEVRQARADLATAEAVAASVQLSGQQALAASQATVDQALGRVAAAISSATAADAVAAADVDAKQAVLDLVRNDPGAAAEAIAVAEADLASAEANAESVRLTGAETIADARQASVDAVAALDAERSQAAAADAVAASEVAAKASALEVLLEPISSSPGEISTAEVELGISIANRDVVQLNGVRLRDEAIAAVAETTSDVAAKQAELSAAETLMANATAAVGTRRSTADSSALEADLARRQAGVQVPADEVVFVASAPVRVAELLVGTGDQALGGMMTVTDALVHVDAALAVADASLVEPGMSVEIAEPDLGIDTEGIVGLVAAAPGTNDVDGFHVYVKITVESPPANLVGASVRLTIPVESTGASVLAVPVSALTLGPNGSSRVQRQVDGVSELVDVEAGLSADGYIEVAAPDGSLRAGDLVVIGLEAGGAASDPALGVVDTVADTRVDASVVSGG